MNIYRKILYVLPLATLLALVGCGPSGNSFRLTGSLEGMEAGELYIYNTSADNARFDTLHVENGKFYYGGTAEEPTPYVIVYPNAVEQVVFIGPGDEIEYEAVSNDLNNYKVGGSDDNKIMSKFRSETQNASYSKIQAAARKYIEENTKSIVALYLFDHYFVQNNQTSYKELNEVLRTLRKDNKENTYFMTLEGKVKAMNTVNVGDVFPNLSLKGKHDSIKLWSKASSEHTLFVCWATWVNASYEFLMKMRQVVNDNPSSKVRVIGFSIDAEYDRWDSMVRYDSIMHLEHYIDTRAFESPILKQIGTSQIPTYFFIDKNHKVVAKGTTPMQLDADIKKYAKE